MTPLHEEELFIMTHLYTEVCESKAYDNVSNDSTINVHAFKAFQKFSAFNYLYCLINNDSANYFRTSSLMPIKGRNFQ